MKEACKIVRAEFITSATSIHDAPPQEVGEVVFLGRSNVGKSSTLNSLCNRKGLAKSSATPGKTRLINFFEAEYLCDKERYVLRFVDLPGFGYAKVSKQMQQEWQKHLVHFISKREAIRLFIHLKDARHPHMPIDREVETFLRSLLGGDQRLLSVFTKSDKLKQKERAALMREDRDAILISNHKKTGLQRLHQEILYTLYGVKWGE